MFKCAAIFSLFASVVRNYYYFLSVWDGEKPIALIYLKPVATDVYQKNLAVTCNQIDQGLFSVVVQHDLLSFLGYRKDKLVQRSPLLYAYLCLGKCWGRS